MSFRDFNRRTAPQKNYTGGLSFRDMKAVSRTPEKSEPLPEIPEKPQVAQNVSVPVPPIPNSVIYSRTVQPNISIQAGYTNLSRYPKSVYIQQPPPVKNTSIPQSIPLNKRHSQFIYYSQNPPQPTPVQPFVPPPPPQQENPDPSRFVEEYVPTPPPKMVKAKVQNVRQKPVSSTGDFGSTFDGNPDQSTPIAELPDIPVMDNINDFKI